MSQQVAPSGSDQSTWNELMNEVWRPVKGYEGLYEVSDYGRVRSLARVDSSGKRRRGVMLEARPSGSGYRKVSLSNHGKVMQINLHKLVALHFLPNPNNLPEIDHKNNNRADNRACNLNWVTASENRRYSYTRGYRKVNEDHMRKMQLARWSD